MARLRYLLGENELPTHWYNVVADLPEELAPPIDAKGNPINPDRQTDFLIDDLIDQETCQQRWVSIPEQVREVYRQWRPTALVRASRLEERLGTPAKIYYKYEGRSPAGSHKANTAVAQAWFNKKRGIKRLISETGGGQWGFALAHACQLFGLECEVFMTENALELKPQQRTLMQAWGAKLHQVKGSLSEARSLALERVAQDPDARYAASSLLSLVSLHQSVMGLEAIKQFAMAGELPDVIFAASGAGSSFGGIVFPFLEQKMEHKSMRLVAVEPKGWASLGHGSYGYQTSDSKGIAPRYKMYSLGADHQGPEILALGLGFHGQSPLVSHLYHHGLIEAAEVEQNESLKAGLLFAKAEGVLPSPESCYAIKAALDQAEEYKRTQEKGKIFLSVSGHGYFDLHAFQEILENPV